MISDYVAVSKDDYIVVDLAILLGHNQHVQRLAIGSRLIDENLCLAFDRLVGIVGTVESLAVVRPARIQRGEVSRCHLSRIERSRKRNRLGWAG